MKIYFRIYLFIFFLGNSIFFIQAQEKKTPKGIPCQTEGCTLKFSILENSIPTKKIGEEEFFLEKERKENKQPKIQFTEEEKKAFLSRESLKWKESSNSTDSSAVVYTENLKSKLKKISEDWKEKKANSQLKKAQSKIQTTQTLSPTPTLELKEKISNASILEPNLPSEEE